MRRCARAALRARGPRPHPSAERTGCACYGPHIMAMTPSPAGAALPPEETLFEGRPAAVAGIGALLVAILTLGLGYLYYWLRTRGVSYKVTTRRVLVGRGLLSKRLEQVDAFRIRDFVGSRP